MENEFVCRCNMCDNLLIDENPKTDAQKIKLTGNELSMIHVAEEHWKTDEMNYFWACPVCKTDSYLMDLE